MWMADTSIEQAQVVVNLRHCSHGRTRIVRRSLLVDRDSGREAIDMIDIWLLHFVQELTSVGGQRFNVTTLSFSKNGIKGKATFARARKPSDDDDFVTGYSYIDVFQIVFTSTTNYYFVLRHIIGPPIPQIDSPQVVFHLARLGGKTCELRIC